MYSTRERRDYHFSLFQKYAKNRCIINVVEKTVTTDDSFIIFAYMTDSIRGIEVTNIWLDELLDEPTRDFCKSRVRLCGAS